MHVKISKSLIDNHENFLRLIHNDNYRLVKNIENLGGLNLNVCVLKGEQVDTVDIILYNKEGQSVLLTVDTIEANEHFAPVIEI